MLCRGVNIYNEVFQEFATNNAFTIYNPYLKMLLGKNLF